MRDDTIMALMVLSSSLFSIALILLLEWTLRRDLRRDRGELHMVEILPGGYVLHLRSCWCSRERS